MSKCIYEQRSVITPPFPISLPNNTPVEIARLSIYRAHQHQCNCISINSVVNWSATFAPPANISPTLSIPGYVDVTFELLFNGNIIYRVLQTAPQKSIPLPPALFSNPSTTYQIATLLHCNQNTFCCSPCGYYDILTLQATANLTAAIVSTGTATTTANVGAVSLLAEIFETHRVEDGVEPK